MQLPNAKDLKKLAAACRKAGIKTFKGDGIEFTLTDELPAQRPVKPKAIESTTDSSIIDNDSLTEDQLLMWSAGSLEDEVQNQ